MAKQSESSGKLTQREYAAIHLAVPDSGTEWLDEMIRKSANYKDPVADMGSTTAPKPPSPKKSTPKKSDD